MVALLGYTDPLRSEAPEVIRTLQAQGIKEIVIALAWPSIPGGQERDLMTSHTSDTPLHDSPAQARDIEALAREAHVPLDDVAQLYARELAALTAGARITSFLPILTTRKVRAILRQRCHASRIPATLDGPMPAQSTLPED